MDCFFVNGRLIQRLLAMPCDFEATVEIQHNPTSAQSKVHKDMSQVGVEELYLSAKTSDRNLMDHL